MATTTPQTLVPAGITVTLGGTTINSVDVEFSARIDNQARYEELMDIAGKKVYVLRKGIDISQALDVLLTIVQTPDKKQDATIKTLTEFMQNTTKNADPAKYTKDAAIVLENSSGEKFLDITFSAVLKDFNELASPEGTDFTKFLAEIVTFDSTTVKISK